MRSEKAHAAAKAFKRERKRIGKAKGAKPERDPKYLVYVHELPCACCVGIEALLRFCTGTHTWGDVADLMANLKGPTEAAHMGPHGIAQKASDWTCIPLCARHHREGPDSAHKLGKRFAKHHRIKLAKFQAKLRAEYERRT